MKVFAPYLARSLNHKDNFFVLAGWSALHYAAQYGSIEIVVRIFGSAQSPDPLTNEKETPLGLACRCNSQDIGERKLLKDWLLEQTEIKEKKNENSTNSVQLI